jgi:hypothetical protein
MKMLAYKFNENGGLKFVQFPLLLETGLVRHGFSTRLGGISPAPYNTLNLGLHVGDVKENVLENRMRIAGAVGINAKVMVAGAQVHHDKVTVVTEEHLGCGAKSDQDSLPGVDALVTNCPGVPLASFYADCVPLFILDPVKRVAALAHAGWKGTVLRIAEKTIVKMVSAFSCSPGDCLAVIGPSIGRCCYEVDGKVITELKRGYKNWRNFVEGTEKGRWKLDLSAANRAAFLDAGLKPGNVVNADLCTSCNQDLFFSHRASGGKTGRMGAIMELKKL